MYGSINWSLVVLTLGVSNNFILMSTLPLIMHNVGKILYRDNFCLYVLHTCFYSSVCTGDLSWVLKCPVPPLMAVIENQHKLPEEGPRGHCFTPSVDYVGSEKYPGIACIVV